MFLPTFTNLSAMSCRFRCRHLVVFPSFVPCGLHVCHLVITFGQQEGKSFLETRPNVALEIILESRKVKVDLKGWKGKTALMFAAGVGNDVGFKLLLQRVKNLTEPSVAIAIRDFYGATPLAMTARFGDNVTVERLLARDIPSTSQLTVRDKFGGAQ